MADKIKKKVKVKKAAPAPVSLNPAAVLAEDDDQYISSDFQSINDTDNTSSASSVSNTDDDEFEKLLNDFISNELSDFDEQIEEIKEDIAQNRPAPQTIKEQNPLNTQDKFAASLAEEEKALFTAYKNFEEAIYIIADQNNLSRPDFSIDAEDLYPRYKPKKGEIFVEDTVKGWDIMIKTNAPRLASISPTASDEELLDFAEKTTSETLQMAVISYVEILIEMEGCEIAYEERRLKAQKRKIEKKVYEEHYARQERMKRYIKSIEENKLPIDAEKLVVNYFKTAKKDPDGAYQMLVNNPATYSPIDVRKIPDRLFGLIKATPQDGIKWNKKIGDFLRKLKA